ncbi:MAG: heparinase II/III-family protein, partial [Anaerolineaceae bacterium]|nr:heparinase II/III-family protein [Anaerolineaceae bacterium]
HRMMLMLALWMNTLLLEKGRKLGQKTKERLSLAVNWLVGQYDHISGRVSNLGHNDGSHILPFSSAPYDDYQPILSAASRAFAKEPALLAGDWDDLSLWLGILTKEKPNLLVPKEATRIGNKESWASLRAVQYTSRPAHADQLHVDLWYQGHNITLDPGTFQYNAHTPWDNGLARSLVHNTVTINGKDQMVRGGRFLWLDWAQAKILESNENMICAEHYGYRKMNAVHRRTINKISNTNWEISDLIYGAKSTDEKFSAKLHWLLPNWPLDYKNGLFSISAPFGSIDLQISTETDIFLGISNIFYEGIAVLGKERDEPLLGWYSPTYGLKIPAYSILFSIEKKLPISITSKFTFS